MSDILQIIGSIVLAIIPALMWGIFFYKKNPEDKKLLALTFFIGALSVFPILIYKFFWNFFPWINAFRLAEKFQDNLIPITTSLTLPISVLITFMIVGVIEESMKYFSVKMVDDDYFQSIDDAIEFFIVAALGFSFSENILYFYNIWINEGVHNLILPFLFRSSFSTFAHILFSGIFGYYYGIAQFAKPILQEELMAKRSKFTILLHKITSIKKERLFHEQKMTEGFLLAVFLHASFNIFLELNLIFMMIPFLIGGYHTLNHLFSKKNAHKNYQKLMVGKRTNPGHSGIFFKLTPISINEKINE
jgi:RsiW-degrading membrane proteinase PrsW (M82 family)